MSKKVHTNLYTGTICTDPISLTDDAHSSLTRLSLGSHSAGTPLTLGTPLELGSHSP